MYTICIYGHTYIHVNSLNEHEAMLKCKLKLTGLMDANERTHKSIQNQVEIYYMVGVVCQ